MLIEVKELQKEYGSGKEYHTLALNHVNFSVEKGEFVGIMGASGSGKSTLLNLLATIDRPTKGSILYEGKDITKLSREDLAQFRKKYLGFVFQEYNLLNTLTIEENIILSLSLHGIERNEMIQRVKEIAMILGIDGILNKFPYQVSGGQRQRCACARAIVTNPQLLLADEPTGALDSKSAEELLKTFTLINKEYHSTILMVTHDIFSASYCDRVIFMQDGKMGPQIRKQNGNQEEMLQKLITYITNRSEIKDDK